MISVHLVEEAGVPHQHPVVAGALHEHPPPRQVSRLHPAATPPCPHQLARLLPREHVAGVPVHQHHLLLGRDDLRLGELIEPAASAEQEAVPRHKILDAALSGHMQNLEPGRKKLRCKYELYDESHEGYNNNGYLEPGRVDRH